MQKKVSMKDIANKVGVSIALVSYVLNGKEKEKRVGAEVVKKIKETADELNYQPNQIARSLRMKSTKTIGLVVADIANPFFGQLARIIENEAAAYGYTVIIGSSDEDEYKLASVINTLFNRQVDGFIIVPTEGSIEQIRNLIKKKIPLVLMDRFFPKLMTNSVILDNYQATFDTTMHLIKGGYCEITMVASKNKLIHMIERIRGYREAMVANKLDGQIKVIEMSYNLSQEGFMEAFNDLDTKKKSKRALIFATNTLSLTGLYCIHKSCLKIPEDLAFIGFDGGEGFDLFNPPLSYVQQPLEEMGKESFAMLMNTIAGSNKITQIMLSPTLVLRESSGC